MPFVDAVRLARSKETTRPRPFMAVLLTVTGSCCSTFASILSERLALLRFSCGSKPTTGNGHTRITVSYSPDKSLLAGQVNSEAAQTGDRQRQRDCRWRLWTAPTAATHDWGGPPTRRSPLSADTSSVTKAPTPAPRLQPQSTGDGLVMRLPTSSARSCLTAHLLRVKRTTEMTSSADKAGTGQTYAHSVVAVTPSQSLAWSLAAQRRPGQGGAKRSDALAQAAVALFSLAILRFKR